MRPQVSKYLKVFALLFLSIKCEAQEFEWVNFFQGKNMQLSTSMSADPAGNQYSLFKFYDEIKFDTFSIKSTKDRWRSLVVKQNTDGDVLWYSYIRPVDSLTDIYGMASRFNAKGNLIVFIASRYAIVIGADTIKHKGTGNPTLFMIEFDQKGKMVSGKNLFEGNMLQFGPNFASPSHRFVCDQYDNLYISLIFNGQVKIYDSTGFVNYGATSATERYIIFKFSRFGQKFEWANELPYLSSTANPAYMHSLKVDIHGNVYAVTYWGGNTSIVFKGKTVTNPQTNTGILFIWDKYGKGKNWFSIQASGKKSIIGDIAVSDSNSLFISGIYLGDSAKFGSIWKHNNKYGSYFYFALYDINGKLRWVKTEDTSYSAAINYNFGDGSMTNYKDKYFYISLNTHSRVYEPIIIDGQRYMPNKNSGAGMNMKFDEKGNILWGFRTHEPFQSIATDEDNNFYFSGEWGTDSIHFRNYKAYAISIDSYIGKTYDYAIYRGDIYSGPYCAGDSLFVPYTKLGEYADTNIFFAEISDEFGNFTGKEREIGRIKSKNDGLIRGVLPMFKVASSGNYRIRIRSTSPQAQSFYKKDTLRLLIYSRDKANPGTPECVCRGDTVQLSTYGGTKWKWSPKYRMNDSTLRQPLIWPVRDTVYKIIIADSSGCGEPDTAYKKVYMRDNLKAGLAFTDTALCENITLKIPVHFTGGDSNYHWKWYILSPPIWFLIKEGNLKQDDTLSYLTAVDLTTSEKIALILSNECTSKRDTVYLTMSQRKPVEIKTKFRDTLLCNGQLLKYKAIATGGVSKYMQYQWKDLITNTVLSTQDSLKITTDKTLKIQLIVNDGCEALGDTAEFEIKVKAKLKATSNLSDTTICFGKNIYYTAQGNGGDSTNHSFSWVLDKKEISKTNTLQLTPNHYSNFSNPTLTLILNDNCSLPNDTIKKTIKILPSPIAGFSFDLACNRTITNFKFTGTKPQAPIITSFSWNLNNEASSTLENPSKLFSTIGTKKINLTLTASNGCMDTLTKVVIIKFQSKADFTTADVCESDSAIFKNLSQDATGYNWKFGDGKTSGKQNPKNKYQITTSTTFNVTLVALVANGCSDSLVKPITINQNPNSVFTSTQAINKLDLKAKAGYTKYNWKIETTDSFTTTSPNYTYTLKNYTPHKVCLTVTDAIGCQSETCKTITLGISKISKSQGFKIYPNPNAGNFIIEIENSGKDGSIEVYNPLGELVERVEKIGKVNIIDFNFANGIYLVRVKNGNEVWNQKVVVSDGEDTNR